MRNYKSDSTTIIQIVCAIIFVLFTIHYIVSFQGDILGMMQYSWSNHETHYNRFVGGGIIIVVLLIITYLAGLFLSFPTRLKTLVYMPAMVIMGQLTAVTVDDAGVVTMPWHPAWITILLLILYPFIVNWLSKVHLSSGLPHDAENALQWLTNGLILVVLIIITYSLGNTDRNLHTRLAVERLCHEGRYAEARAEGIPQHDHGTGITMFRALALAYPQSSLLGDSLFTYNIDGDNRTLLPRQGSEPHTLLFGNYQIWQTIGFVPRDINEDPVKYIKRELKRNMARPAAKDYLLCTYLLRKNLKDFAFALPRFYNLKESLPKHYAEALTMYYSDPVHQAQMQKDSVCLDNAMIEDYNDFQDMLHAKNSKTVKASCLRDNFFGTYWYYYYREN